MLDTFAGIGGFSYAATKLVKGFQTTQFIELDPFCQKILKKNFPNVPIHDDIRTYTALSGQFDIICGGFPCQDISGANTSRVGITEESRSGLFYELMRIIRMVRPRFVVLENVAAILNNGLDIVLGELSQAGYDAEWSIISASSLGACHRRSRWWCVAYTDSFGCGRGSSKRCSIQERTFFSGKQRRSEMGSEIKRCSSQSSNSNSVRLERKKWSGIYRETWDSEDTRCLNPDWRSYVSKPLLPRGSDGLSFRVDRTKALGNSVVPQVATIPLQRVYDIYSNEKR